MSEILNKLNELKATNEALKSAHEEYARTNDSLKAAEVARINDAMTGMQEQIDAMAVAKNRPASEGKTKTDPSYSKLLRKGERFLTVEEQKAMSATGADATDGSHTIPEVVYSEIVAKRYELSPFRGLAGVYTTAADHLEFLVETGEFGSGWVAEEAARTTTANAKIDTLKVYVHEQYAEPKVTKRLLEDSAFALENWVNTKVGERLARVESAAFLTGDGSGKPFGLLTRANATQSNNAPKLIDSKTVGAVTVDDFIGMIYDANQNYLAGAQFMMGKSTLAAVRLLKDTTGQYLWQPAVAAGEPSTIHGYGIAVNPDMPLLANGAKAVTFGDHRAAYAIVDRNAVIMIRDDITEKQNVKFYHRARVGGDVINGFAVSVLQIRAS